MKKIVFVEMYYASKGHHRIYADTVMNGVTGFEVGRDPFTSIGFSRGKVIRFLFSLFMRRNLHFHFLTVDPFLGTMKMFYPLFKWMKKRNGLTLSCTYHNFDRNETLNQVHDLFDAVVTHTEPTGPPLVFKPVIISHPSFLDAAWSRRAHIDTFRIGFLGGNRPEKRYDLFIEAMNRLNGEVEVVAGGQDTDLESKGLTLNKQHKILSRHLTDDELRGLIEYIDLLVVPYDRSFTGQSGPLSEAAYANKSIVCSDAPIIKRFVEENKLGEVFTSGDAADLVRKIEKIRANYSRYEIDPKFRREHSKALFAQRYLSMFQSAQGKSN